MSLPPQRKPVDLDKFTNAYIANLNAQIANNAKVYNAVMANLTGQVLPSAPVDTRPIEEKLLDFEKLKMELKNQLKTITDGNNSLMIMNELARPENQYRLQMAVQSFPALSALLKPSYDLGVPAIQFLNSLDRLIERQDTTSGVDIGLQQSTGENLLLSLNEIQNSLADKADYQELLQVLMNNGVTNEKILSDIRFLRDNMLDAGDYQSVEPDSISELTESYADLPTKSIVAEMIGSVEEASFNDEDVDIRSIRDNVSLSPEVKSSIKDIKQQAAEIIKKFKEERAARPPLGRQVSIDPEEERQLQVQEVLKQNPNLRLQSQPAPSGMVRTITEDTDQSGFGLFKKKMRGRGLVSTPSKESSKKIRLKVEGVIEKPKSYFPFGRYALNKNKLEQGILMVRTPSGSAVPKIPTQKISQKLSTILKTVLVNSIPSYEMINDLFDNEKDLLYKVLKESHINHISTPSPNISKQEEDCRRYVILKGQILGGQNSPIAIKELKRLIVKLMSQDILPRREASQALLELAHLETI